MATGNGFAALIKKSRAGAVSTTSEAEPVEQMSTDAPAAAGGIGAFEDDLPPQPQPAKSVLSLPQRKLSFADLASMSAKSQVEDLPPSYSIENGASPLSKLVQSVDSVQGRRARNDLHSIKVLTRLVLAVVNRPGSSSAVLVKTEALRDLIEEIRQASEEILDPLTASGWARAQVMEGLAEIAANRWERYDYDEVQPTAEVARVIADVLRAAGDDPALGAVFDTLRHTSYVRADSEAIARERVEVSTRLAAWELYEAVVNPRLGSEGYRYTYDREPAQIVEMLLPGVVQIAHDCLPSLDDGDMRVAYLQGSIRRVANLAAAEYVTRTREVMNWITKGGPEEEDQRLGVASAELETKVLPSVLDWARKNFLAIEAAAPKFLEPRKEHENHKERRVG